MAIELATQFLPYVDEQFATESKLSMVTNKDFDWTGAHAVKVYKVSTSEMNDYDRDGSTLGADKWSRYGKLNNLNATTEELILQKDRSFTFPVDKLDTDETKAQLEAASALARQNREVVIPEIDSYVFSVMAENAGTKAEQAVLDSQTIYTLIAAATEAMDNAEVPEAGRVLIVTPSVYTAMKQCKDIVMETDVGNEMRQKGVLGLLDGCSVVKVPASRLPAGFGFMMAHPCATVAPVKLEDYTVHNNPPGISGDLVEGRICYDAFVLDNKKMAVYYQPVKIAGT